MDILVILRYITILITIAVINFIVYTVLPGNVILAMIICFTFILTLIPSESTNKSSKEMEENKITFDELLHPLNLSDMTMEEKNLHEAMGNVFNAMAHDAGRDIYSSEISGTEKILEKENNPNRKFFSNFNTDNQSKSDFSTSLSQEIPKIRLEVSQDGKLHYIFLKEENDVEESPKSLSDTAPEDTNFEAIDDLIEILESRLNEYDQEKENKIEKKLQLSE